MRKLICLLAFMLIGCGNYQYISNAKYIDAQTSVEQVRHVFSNYNVDLITIEFKPFKPVFHYGHSYGYWGTRPLWLDFDFYHGNYYSYYSHFYRPWNSWDYYMRPWRPFNNWTQGPFNNQGYNVVYNSSRRTRIKNNIINKPNRSRVILNKKPVVTYKPVVKPRVNYNNNNSKPNFNSKPNYNSKPSFNSRPSYNNSKPSYNSSTRTNTLSLNRKGGKN